MPDVFDIFDPDPRVMTHPAAIDPDELRRQCDLLRAKRGGPGGQRRNKVETAVELVHKPTGQRGHAGERRSPAENQRVALKRLRINLAIHHRETADLTRAPSQRWQDRTRNDQTLAINPRHDDYPALLAEALDVIHACAYDLRRAATLQRITRTQLIKLLRHQPDAFDTVNQQRQQHGRPAVR
ncbi:peptide chain release factor family protein [Mucisphaera calidilacus]|uniref:Peptide chain release factor 1 n=1 Tax=Mucisphaera calidilacus TaxID=2527982 RepID=A0A518C112_9BACT|nr:peptide chain release factor-like protein [Mucisphaera calidilacus]QDU72916.1 Peptide chain release factor 1 [Mucisphaera calidilacus]